MKKLAFVLIALLLVMGAMAGCTEATTQGSDQAAEGNEQAQGDGDAATEDTSASDDTADTASDDTEKTNLELSLEADAAVLALTASDGRPLIIEPDLDKVIPERPADPEALADDDLLRWYDLEFAGWSGEKVNIPESPADGSIGKKVILIIQGEHPYYTAFAAGAQQVADAYGIELKIMWPNWDLNTQNQMIDQAINERPDLMVVLPLDANATTQQFKKINEAAIPVIANCMVPNDEGLTYCIGWTGPDEWGARRELSKYMVEKLGITEGGYCVIQHAPGGSTFFSRTYGYVSELAQIAPNMTLLDAQAPGFDAEKTKQLTLDWITKYGDDLKVIFAADDSAQSVGVIEALKQAGRDDITFIAAGNSKVGMDAVKAGDIAVINYESAEANGASAIKMAADWFNGKDILPVYYMPLEIIDSNNVDDFYPAQW